MIKRPWADLPLVTAIVIGWLMLLGGLFQGFHAISNRRWAGSGWAPRTGGVLSCLGEDRMLD